jgi:putative transcriptional regulator
MTLEEAARAGRIDHAKVGSTSEEDIRRHMVEDGEDPDASLPTAVRVVESPGSLRAKLGLTPTELAERLGLPVTTWFD